MKKMLELINTLDRVETTTLDQRIVKQAGIKAMMDNIKDLYPNYQIEYIPGKGYTGKF